VLRIKTYLERLQLAGLRSNLSFPLSPATVNQIQISNRVEMQETMLTGLRLVREGVSDLDFTARFGVQMQHVFGREIDELISLSLLEWSGSILRLTKRGRLLGNQVFMRFVD
jgi:oxygen-independent coproporphyrinogen-3 oxidase